MIAVRGAATPEEVAALLAALSEARAGSARPPEPSRYERWRRQRLTALRQR